MINAIVFLLILSMSSTAYAAKTLTYHKNHKLTQLHTELVTAGVEPMHVEGDEVDVIKITVPDATPDLVVTNVVTAHTPIEEPPIEIYNLGNLKSMSGEVTTVGNELVSLITIPTKTNQSFSIRSYVTGLASNGLGGIDVAANLRLIKIKNSAGVVTLTSLQNTNNADTGINNATINVVVSGTNVVFQAQGHLAKTIKWSGSVVYAEETL